MKKHVLLSFLSLVKLAGNQLSISEYTRANGTVFDVVQTNETAICYLEDKLHAMQEHIDCIFYFSTTSVQNEMLNFVDNQGREQTQTHEAIFLQRLKQQYPHINCVAVPFDDNADTYASIRQTTDMSDKIMTHFREQGWNTDDIVVHVDMTGGLRYASMMMLAVMQFMKYRHIPVVEVVYSNWKKGIPNTVTVQDVTEVYRMFNLVSGADEFVNFGSVKEIDDYFKGRKQSDELRHLLDTMRLFSDAIKICRTQIMKKSVHQLSDALQAFEQTKNKSLQEALFLQIIDVFRTEYGKLLTESVTDFDIIRWCVRKGFLQQAMTLCTEWLPTHIVEKKICYPGDNKIEINCGKNKKDYHTWQQNFITTYCTGAQSMPLTSVRNHIAEIFETYDKTKNIEQSVQIFPAVAKQCRAFFREFEQQKSFLSQSYIDYNELKKVTKKYPALYRVLHVLWADQLRKNVSNYSGFISFIGRLRVETLIRQLISLKIPDYEKALNVNLDAGENQDSSSSSNSSNTDKWERRLAQYEQLFSSGVMKSNYATDKALTILEGYYHIRTGRNEMNHANDESVMMSDKIEELIQTTLDEIEGIS